MIAGNTISFFCLLILFLPLGAFVVNIFLGKGFLAKEIGYP